MDLHNYSLRSRMAKQIYGVITGLARAAPEGTCTQGGGIELPCKGKIYGRENCKDMVQNLLKE